MGAIVTDTAHTHTFEMRGEELSVGDEPKNEKSLTVESEHVDEFL